MSTTAVPRSACSRSSRSMIWAWTVTSRAVVGSSASSTAGSRARAMAIMARCRIPPENWWGYSCARWAGLGMPTSASRSTARLRAATRPTFSWTWMTSAIWWPTWNTGLSDVSGSWKIIEISLPRMARSSFSPAVSRSRPPKQDPARLELARRHRHQAHHGQGRHRLARPRLPHDAERLAPPDRPAHPVDRLHHARVGVEVDPQVLHAQQRSVAHGGRRGDAGSHLDGGHRSRGSSASRSPSPTNTKPRTVNTTAMLGKNQRKSLYPKNFWPAEIMFPQSGTSGGSPTPR